MKICLFGNAATPELPLGNHNLKDPRLDQAHKLVEAKKKIPVQVELISAEALVDADAILVDRDHRADLILQDLELVETRLGRTPPEPEAVALKKLQAGFENEKLFSEIELTDEDREALAVHAFITHGPIVVADPEEFQEPESLLLRAYREGGYISFLTVGGKENRAWPIRQGVSAVDAAGSVHTDMQKGFIRAEVIGWQDFVEAGGETQAKRAGKLRLEIKTYVVQDYDVLNFRFNR